MPADRLVAVALLDETTQMLLNRLKVDRIPAAVRRPSETIGGMSLLELAQQQRFDELRDAVRSMFDIARLQPYPSCPASPSPDGHEWLRVADPAWDDPIDTSCSVATSGRWNPPHTWAALYLSHNLDTARPQVLRLLEGTPFEPDDLADDAYDLVTMTLPDGQTALDVASDAGVAAVGLPASYPATAAGARVPHEECWSIREGAQEAALDGVWCRSAATLDGAGRERAWWPGDRSAHWNHERSPYGDWR